MCLAFVIPAFNEEAFIAHTIQRIVNLIKDLPGCEIIIVDNASTDRTPEILNQFPQIEVLRLPEKVTISAARNAGWKIANSEIIAFIDADVLITERWITEYKNSKSDLTLNPNQITGCRYILSESPGWIECSWFKSMKQGHLTYINSGNLVTTKSVLEKINGFDVNLITGEDVDFCKRATLAGTKLNINNNWIAHHEGYPKTLKSFFKREQWHGTGDVKSFATIFSSKVAVFSFLTTILLMMAVLQMFLFSTRAGLGLIAAAIVLNSLAVIHRFNIENFSDFSKLLFLQMNYSLARSLSIFKRKKI